MFSIVAQMAAELCLLKIRALHLFIVMNQTFIHVSSEDNRVAGGKTGNFY